MAFSNTHIDLDWPLIDKQQDSLKNLYIKKYKKNSQDSKITYILYNALS